MAQSTLTKAETDKLVKAYALMLYSAKNGAPFKTQQSLYDAFYKLSDAVNKSMEHG